MKQTNQPEASVLRQLVDDILEDYLEGNLSRAAMWERVEGMGSEVVEELSEALASL